MKADYRARATGKLRWPASHGAQTGTKPADQVPDRPGGAATEPPDHESLQRARGIFWMNQKRNTSPPPVAMSLSTIVDCIPSSRECFHVRKMVVLPFCKPCVCFFYGAVGSGRGQGKVFSGKAWAWKRRPEFNEMCASMTEVKKAQWAGVPPWRVESIITGTVGNNDDVQVPARAGTRVENQRPGAGISLLRQVMRPVAQGSTGSAPGQRQDRQARRGWSAAALPSQARRLQPTPAQASGVSLH